ncbi:MAG: radical SAM protein [Deltaproteobacteria bacterium]|nr:radical SAM protein [Deltaproteobacteria bacterium]
MRIDAERSSEFNRRFGIRFEDGARVEAVLYRGDTLCISTQVGCSVGCPFCASGAQGLARSLKLPELVGQITCVRERGYEVKRVTLSGVGEPLLNPACVEFVHACRAERVPPSVTTSGGSAELLRRWLHLPHNGLTLSVHAGEESTRARLVPGAPNLATLFDVLQEHLPKLSRSRRKKVALAYLLLAGENDSDEELDAFAERALPLAFDVQLYSQNAVAHSGLRSPEEPRLDAIKRRLEATGLHVRRSSKARREANGGCGTLLALGPGDSRKQ